MVLIEKIQLKFVELYGQKARLFQSPGRINLIGEHTDYNKGFVLPAAINKKVVVAIRENDKACIRLHAIDYNESIELSLNETQKQKSFWSNYVLGVVSQFRKEGLTIQGFDCVIGGDIPIGAGLSSSAALSCAVAFAINKLFAFNLERAKLMGFAQKAEHEFAGVECGLMDQFASLFGREEGFMLLDCQSMDYKYIRLNNSDYEILLCDTKVKHNLASSEYNFRKQDCESTVRYFQMQGETVDSLRDLNLGQIQKAKASLSSNSFKRSCFVLEENDRVINAIKAIEENNMIKLGQLLFQSHAGLRDLYEVSCPELDALVNFASKSEGVLGARMMGGGFGGCTINLIEKKSVEAFKESVQVFYREEFGAELDLYSVDVAQGTSEIIM